MLDPNTVSTLVKSQFRIFAAIMDKDGDGNVSMEEIDDLFDDVEEEDEPTSIYYRARGGKRQKPRNKNSMKGLKPERALESQDRSKEMDKKVTAAKRQPCFND